MSLNKRSLLKALLTANGSCGCGTPKRSDVYEPTPKPKISISENPNPSSLTSSTTSDDEDLTSTSISEAETDHHKSSDQNIIPKLIDSIAVEKNSVDPYNDFRDSMLQMITEKEMYSEADLQELLQCFLRLNSPRHHQVIVKAFTEICQQPFPNKATAGEAQLNQSEC